MDGTNEKGSTSFLLEMGTYNLQTSYGFNRRVQEDIVDDSEASIIVAMNCLDPSLDKDNNTVYTTCVIPPTLISTEKWVHFWHKAMMAVTALMCFIGPFSLAFRRTTVIAYYITFLLNFISPVITILFIADVFVEIMTACPVSGYHYKFKDGLHVKLKQYGFYFDIFAAVPVEAVFWFTSKEVTATLIYATYVATLSECLKLWKLVRYLHFLDDVYPEQLFVFRLLQTSTMLLYIIHFLACIMFTLACETPPEYPIGQTRNCHIQTWLSSYYITELMSSNIKNEALSPTKIANTIPYLISIYFSTSTLSSAGYGDFSPQSIGEMCVLIVSEVIGFYIVGYYTSLLTSALSCTTRPKINFQQKLASISQFLKVNGMSGTLKDRIVEHYRLQYQHTDGVPLPSGTKHLMYDAPPYLEEDVLFAEAEIHLEGIPIFTKVDPKVIIRTAKLMTRYILPPNIYFVRRGDVRRQMYVIYKGSVAVLHSTDNNVKLILEATGHFGVQDLLFGEPHFNHIKTLSYCLIYAIDLNTFNEVFERDEDLFAEIETIKRQDREFQYKISRAREIFSLLGKVRERAPTAIPSFIPFPTSRKPVADFCDFEEFIEPYEGRMGAFLRLFLMRRTIHPAGTFALCWQLAIAIVSLILLIGTFISAATLFGGIIFRLHRYCCGILLFTDIYVKMHWAYYTESNHLITHPIKTSSHFLFEGPFIYSFLCGLVPYELLVLPVTITFNQFVVGFQGDSAWVSKFRWNQVYLSIRVPIILQFGRNVFTMREMVLLFMYVMMTLALCTVIASYALYTACPWSSDPLEEATKNLLPACLADSWVSKKEHVGDLSKYTPRWILALYYVCQTTLVIGYGDFVSIEERDLHLAIFMMIVGFLILRCIISDMTAAAVDSDEVRAKYSEQMKCIQAVLERESIHPRLISNTIEHMKHTWLMSKGLQPQELLNDLHPSLEADLFREYVGDALSKVPILFGVPDNVITTICQFMQKLYFQRGERITRRGNLEYEMHIIVDGDTWVCGKGLELKCTLGRGESIGETQMMFGKQRKYSVIAATNVEVFALSAPNYTLILDRYPPLRTTMLENLLGMQVPMYNKKINKVDKIQLTETELTKDYHNTDIQDIFERKIFFIKQGILKKKLRATSTNTDPSTKIIFNTEIVKEIVSAKDLTSGRDDEDDGYKKAKTKKDILKKQFQEFYHRWIFDYGPDDFDLPFLYFASPTVGKKFSLLIHPKCGLQRFFEFVVMAVCLISPALGTYQLAFTINCRFKHSSFYHYILQVTWILEIVMIIHIVVQFLTPFPTVEGKYCKQYRRIAFRYVVSVTHFWFDVIATLPIQFIQGTLCEDNVEGPIKYFNIIRVLRLIHYYRTQLEKQDSITITTFRYKLAISIPFFALMAHALACVFYVISSCNSSDGDCPRKGTWTDKYLDDFIDRSALSQSELPLSEANWYIRSLYWVVTTISTTGFGDIVAQNLHEIFISIICVFCGAFVLSIILSGFTSGITSLTKANREYMYQVKLLAKYLTNIGLNQERQDQVLTWFLMMWDACRGTSYTTATRVLPLCMQIDVNLAIYENILKEVSLFSGQDKRFLRQVANRLSHTLYLAGFNIVNEGDKGHLLYIVSKGWVAGYKATRHGEPKLMRWYGRGTCFGRLPVLFYHQNYTKSYRAEVTSEILYINQKDIWHLARNYPSFASNLQEFMTKRYKPQMGTGTIFSTHVSVSAIIHEHISEMNALKSEQDKKAKLKKDKEMKELSKLVKHADGSKDSITAVGSPGKKTSLASTPSDPKK